MVQDVRARRNAVGPAAAVKAFDNPLVELAGALLGVAVAALAILVGIAVIVITAVYSAARRLLTLTKFRRDDHAHAPAKARG